MERVLSKLDMSTLIKIFKNFICLICFLLLFVSCDNTNKKNFLLAEDYEREKNYIQAIKTYESIVLSDKKFNSYKEEAKNGYIRTLKEINNYYNEIIRYYENNKQNQEIATFDDDINKIKASNLKINDIIENKSYFKEMPSDDILTLSKETDLKMHNIIRKEEEIIEKKENHIKQNINNYKTLINLYDQAKTLQKANKFKTKIQDITNIINKINKESSLAKKESIIKNTNNKYDIGKIRTELNDIINYKKDHLLGDGYKNLKWGMNKQQVRNLLKKPIVTYSNEHLTFRLSSKTYYDGHSVETWLKCIFIANKLFFVKLQFYSSGFNEEKNLEIADTIKSELRLKFSDAETSDTSSQIDFTLNDLYENYNAYPHGNDTYEEFKESLAFEDEYSKIIFSCYKVFLGIRTEVSYFSKILLEQYVEKEEMLEEQKRQREEERERNRINKQNRDIHNML